jgi:hypothetical protein
VIFGFLKLNFKIGLSDKHIQDVSMIEPINHTGVSAIQSSYMPTPRIPVKRYSFDGGRNISKASSKYILEGNKVVFERYDRNGRLILRVPWTAHKVSTEA